MIVRSILSLTVGLAGLLGISCTASKSDLDNWAGQVEAHQKQSEGGRLIARAMDAHGGLKQWLSNEVLQFRWIYHMNDRGPNAKINTLQRIDTSSLEAIHEVAGSDTRFGWTGEEAWLMPPDAPAQPHPRFWALTPYYFVGIPFVFADLNANYEKLPDGFAFEGVTWDQVKVTYNPGAGDSPDDYYIVLIHPETNMVGGTRYIVTSSIAAPNGPIPEKLITLEHYNELGGIQLPTKHRSFEMEAGRPTQHIRDAEATQYQWLKRGEVDFSVPDGAKIF